MQMEIIVSTPCAAWLTDLPDAAVTGERVVAAALAAALDPAGPNRAVLNRAVVEVGVMLTDNTGIRRLNREYRHQDRATNVLSFAGDGVTGPAHDGPLLLGDIVLAHGVLCAEAKAQGKSLKAHYCHLLVHGTLHLLGHDHDDEGQATAMEAREIAILAEIGIADPYQPAAAEQRISLDPT